ncbi:MAG: SDR family oxidoreductase [Gammaproteobacteria bacterium]|nr:SDR family oxidoreductase [Gammaproteobacteria bacterium]MBQ0839237.1 SDR family oxidoreductase [Gammaproteobacteria bacterium]
MSGILEGKVGLITGAGSGIGRATSIIFADEGAKVVVCDVNEKGGEETVNLITQAGGEAIFVRCDVTDSASVEAMVKACVRNYGQLDCAFNNAGVSGKMANTVMCTEDNFDLNIAVNLKGVWLCMKQQIQQFLEQGTGGAIVSTASIAGLVAAAYAPAYGAAKHGVNGLTKSAAIEFAKKNIRVNSVCPGVIETPMVAQAGSDSKMIDALIAAEPIGRMGQPSEIGHAVAWLCSDKASFVTGHCMPVDGGYVAQ